MDWSKICFLPFAKQNQAEVWPRFQSLLKLLLWNKGVEWVKVLNALDPLCLWQCLEYTTHLKCGLRCGRVWWICGRVGNAKARGKMREIGALCSSDSVQSVPCDIWTHYRCNSKSVHSPSHIWCSLCPGLTVWMDTLYNSKSVHYATTAMYFVQSLLPSLLVMY